MVAIALRKSFRHHKSVKPRLIAQLTKILKPFNIDFKKTALVSKYFPYILHKNRNCKGVAEVSDVESIAKFGYISIIFSFGVILERMKISNLTKLQNQYYRIS